MIIENRNDYIRYRFQRAKESFDEAMILADKQKMECCCKPAVLFMFLCSCGIVAEKQY